MLFSNNDYEQETKILCWRIYNGKRTCVVVERKEEEPRKEK